MADPEGMPLSVNDESSVGKISVEVAYALPYEQVILEAIINQGGTVADAIKHSGILITYPEIDLAINKVGVFGKATKMTTVLRAGDRVEVYRPLIADPKEVRRKRAAEGKQMKKGGGDIKEGSAAPAKAAPDATAIKAAKSDQPGEAAKPPAD